MDHTVSSYNCNSITMLRRHDFWNQNLELFCRLTFQKDLDMLSSSQELMLKRPKCTWMAYGLIKMWIWSNRLIFRLVK